MVVVDGRRPGYSVGMTNFELAQALVRLGAVSASALDGGGSSAMAFNGSLLSRPSNGEQATSTALQLMYYGVYAPTPDPFISPNGDGVAERQRALSYKVVRPSNVTATLVGPGDVTAFTETVDRAPGTYPVAFPPAPLDPTAPACAARRGPLAARRLGDRRSRPDLDHEPVVHGQLDARVREAVAPVAGRARPRQASDSGGRHAHAARTRARHRRDRLGRPRRVDRLAPPSRRAGSSRAGRERPSAADPSSTAASTRSGSAPPTSSASWSSPRRPSA